MVSCVSRSFSMDPSLHPGDALRLGYGQFQQLQGMKRAASTMDWERMSGREQQRQGNTLRAVARQFWATKQLEPGDTPAVHLSQQNSCDFPRVVKGTNDLSMHERLMQVANSRQREASQALSASWQQGSPTTESSSGTQGTSCQARKRAMFSQEHNSTAHLAKRARAAPLPSGSCSTNWTDNAVPREYTEASESTSAYSLQFNSQRSQSQSNTYSDHHQLINGSAHSPEGHSMSLRPGFCPMSQEVTEPAGFDSQLGPLMHRSLHNYPDVEQHFVDHLQSMTDLDVATRGRSAVHHLDNADDFHHNGIDNRSLPSPVGSLQHPTPHCHMSGSIDHSLIPPTNLWSGSSQMLTSTSHHHSHFPGSPHSHEEMVSQALFRAEQLQQQRWLGGQVAQIIAWKKRILAVDNFLASCTLKSMAAELQVQLPDQMDLQSEFGLFQDISLPAHLGGCDAIFHEHFMP